MTTRQVGGHLVTSETPGTRRFGSARGVAVVVG